MPGIFDLLHAGWNLYKKYFRYYLPFVVILFAFTLGFSFFAEFYGPTWGTVMARNYNEVISFLIIGIPISLVLYYLALSLTLALAKKDGGSSPAPASILSSTLKRTPSAIGAHIMATFPLGIAGSILLYLIAKVAAEDVFTIGSLISMLVGVALFILGFIIFMWFSFSHLAALLDNHKPLSATKYSYSLVHGRLLKVAWRAITPAFILAIFASLLDDVFKLIIDQIPTLTQDVRFIVLTTFTTMVAMIVGPWGYAISLKLYQALKKTA